MCDDLQGSHDGGHSGTNDVPIRMSSVILGNVDVSGKEKKISEFARDYMGPNVRLRT